MPVPESNEEFDRLYFFSFLITPGNFPLTASDVFRQYRTQIARGTEFRDFDRIQMPTLNGQDRNGLKEAS